tara:strand:+ start:3224 stop:3955 length:732 start_codon:yes stop_codon:yes gene_type:complete
MKKVLLIQPGPFGDIFICAPIAKWYADQGYKVSWPVREKFLSTIQSFDYVTPIVLSEEVLDKDWLRSDVMKILPMREEYDKVINLADRGPHPTAQQPSENFEACKYRLAEVPFEEKNNLSWTRNIQNENTLLSRVERAEPYVVAHLLNSHGDRAVLPAVPEPLVEITEIEGYTIVDWYKVIKNAKAVYCVESAVHQFIDGFATSDDSENLYLLKKGVVEEGTRHTHSKFWNLKYVGENSVVRG